MNWFSIITTVLPYTLVFGLGFVIGFMSRNSRIDKLMADARKLRAELSGEQIRTSSRTEPVRPVQPRTHTPRTEQPMYGPAHSATRTEPLPTGVRYVVAAEERTDDEPISDDEYARRYMS